MFSTHEPIRLEYSVEAVRVCLSHSGYIRRGVDLDGNVTAIDLEWELCQHPLPFQDTVKEGGGVDRLSSVTKIVDGEAEVSFGVHL